MDIVNDDPALDMDVVSEFEVTRDGHLYALSRTGAAGDAGFISGHI